MVFGARRSSLGSLLLSLLVPRRLLSAASDETRATRANIESSVSRWSSVKRATYPDGWLSGIPTSVLYTALLMEFIYPTLGDDDDCVLVAATGPVEAMHPGYVGAEGLLDGPMSIAADGLCLYHCLVAASDLSVIRAIQYKSGRSVPMHSAENLFSCLMHMGCRNELGGWSYLAVMAILTRKTSCTSLWPAAFLSRSTLVPAMFRTMVPLL